MRKNTTKDSALHDNTKCVKQSVGFLPVGEGDKSHKSAESQRDAIIFSFCLCPESIIKATNSRQHKTMNSSI